ncbi:MAG TPA: LamG-like jellyroll fold domain-containing protein [Nannocystis sp.]
MIAHLPRPRLALALAAPLALLAPTACGDSTAVTATEDGTAESGTTAASSATPTTSAGPGPGPSTVTDPPLTTSAEGSATGTSETTDTPDPPKFCEGEPPLSTSGLVFDGSSSVVMGAAPELGLSTFTLEAWVRRDGRGKSAGTGVGGLKLVPIISKGRGESDGSNVDCNYNFGFYGDVLGADFEDMATGANHPIYGKTALALGTWYHVAATYDGSTWRLYVDGVLDAESKADATPRHDSIQHFGLGAAFNSMGEAAGGLLGAIDEVRVYSRALDAAEILATRDSTTPNPADLVAHYHLDAAEATALDSAGSLPGTIVGASFAAPGAVLDRGAAPELANPQALDAGGARTLSVDVTDAENDTVQVDFYARELTPADDFTIVALPDTQYYTRDAAPPTRPNPDDPEYFKAQTRWAWDHRVERNVIGLLTLGDIINNSDQPNQWKRASASLGILEDLSDPAYPEGLPYAASYGNHDQNPKDMPEATKEANSYFGVERFGKRSYYGGNFDGDNDENYVYFQTGGLPVVIVNFQFNPEPDADVLAWARGVFESHPRALGIVTTHYIVTGGGNFSDQGKAIYAALKDVPNVQLMASGHVAQAARRTDEFEGNVIHSMLSDYQRSAPDPDDPSRPIVVAQSQTNGGQGYMRIWNFAPSRQELFVESYSPKKDAAYTDEQNEFTLAVDLLGAGRSPFIPVGTTTAEGGTATVELPNFAADKTYEWYAVARDCSHARPLDLQQILPAP